MPSLNKKETSKEILAESFREQSKVKNRVLIYEMSDKEKTEYEKILDAKN